MSLTVAAARRIALSFAGTEERFTQGSPKVYVGKELLIGLSCREPGALMLRTAGIEERDMLIEADPATFFVNGHFKDYKGCLARLTRLDAKTLRAILARRWKEIAPRPRRPRSVISGRGTPCGSRSKAGSTN